MFSCGEEKSFVIDMHQTQTIFPVAVTGLFTLVLGKCEDRAAIQENPGNWYVATARRHALVPN